MARPSNKPLLLFSGGEITPLLAGRTDVERMPASCRTLQNMVVETQGPVTRRPGLQYIGSIKGGSIAEQSIVVYDSIAANGSRGFDVWSMTAEMTLYPTFDPASQRFRSPDFHVTGNFTGTAVISTVQVLTATEAVWVMNFRMEPGTNPNHRYWIGGAYDEIPPGFVDGPLLTVPFPLIGYVPPMPFEFVAGTYYRFALAGQVDPLGAFGPTVLSNWFTLDGGFEADGFTPP